MSKAKKSSKRVKARTAKSSAKPAKASRKGSTTKKPANSVDELIKTFDKLIGVIMFDSPLEIFDAIASKDLMAYGTTLYEKTLDLSSFKAAILTQREQSKGLDLAIRRIPVFAKVSKSGMSGIVVEELEITITGVGASPFASLARVSVAFSLKANQWEAMLVHASRPEHDSEGRDSWHVEEWSTRVAELEQQVRERTADLLLKNRELEIEAALERVRASAMAMHHSEELAKVGEVIFAQLVALGIRLETITFTTNFSGSDFDVWMVAGGVAFPKQVIIPYFDHPYFNSAKEVFEKGGDSWSIVFDKATKNSFFKHVYEHAAELYPQGRIEFALGTPGYSVSNVKVEDLWLGMARYSMEPFADEENVLFRRFRNVFTQAYTRFLDLKKAEEQAREAVIEMALEKVRSQSLAMHKSEDIQLVVHSMFERLRELDVSPDTTNIFLFTPGSKDIAIWLSNALQLSYADPFIIPENDTRIGREALEAWEHGEGIVSRCATHEEKVEFFEYLYSQTNFSRIPADRRKFISDSPYYTNSTAVVNNVGLNIISYSRAEFSRAEHEILKRFTRVFEQAYIRFRDLQKAEEQAREASIEAALERVRSRSMAMHKSDELKDIIATVTEQLLHLGTRLDTASFNFVNDDGSIDLWMSNPEFTYPLIIHLPYLDNPVFNQRLNVNERGVVSYSLNSGEKDAFIRHFFKQTNVPEERQKLAFDTPGFAVTGVQLKHVYVAIQNYRGELYTQEENEVFLRFGKVFEQAYTRFLDLEKAEAQAVEAKIEGALEKVRSRSLAMHKSEEMTEVVSEVMTRLKDLDVDVESTNILVYNEGSPDFEVWSAGTQAYSIKFHVPISSTPHLQQVVRAIGRQESLVASSYSFEEKNSWFNFLFENTEFSQIASDRKKYIMESPLMGISVGLSKNVGIQINSYHQPVFSTRENEIVIRFARVFEQAYTRFLDLEKAEAQAREAEIELALERIRARTMAMHRSEELPEVTAVLFQQMKAFGFDALMSIVLYDPTTKGYEMLMSSDVQSVLPKAYKVPYFDNSFYRKFISSFAEGVPYKEFEFGGEEKRDYDRKFFTETDFRDLPETSKQLMIALERCTLCCAYMKFGCIEAIGERPLQPEHAVTLQRFTKVFEQTYTRFLDLQKAEAQAREAQIEAALERVRSSAMAMRTSDELAVLIGKVFHECTKLDIPLDRGIIMIFDPVTSDSRWWLAGPEATELPKSYLVQYNDYAPYLPYVQGWKERRVKSTYLLEGEVKKNWDAFLFVETELSLLPEQVKAGMRGIQSVHLNTSFNNFGGITLSSAVPISDEDFDVILRFAKVFDLTYTRFNDLRQAEANTREAKIEAALERVRAKAMAMHNSEDLSSAASMVFMELQNLGVKAIRCGVVLLNKDSRLAKAYSAIDENGTDSLALIGEFEMSGHPALEAQFQSWISKENFVTEISGPELTDYYRILNKIFTMPLELESQGRKLEYGYYFPFSEGLMYSWSETQYDQDQTSTLNRFKSIIDLTFRRYMELQNAEANAMEASRQASLDRVRAEIASMRTTTDLERITPLIWRELNSLGVPFVRCGVFIMDEQQQRIQTFLSTPDGKAIAAFNLPYDSIGNLQGAVSSWRAHQTFVTHWLDKDFQAQADVLVKEGAVTSREQYLSTIPREGIHLHFLPFLQGMIYVGSMEPLSTDHMHVILSVADAFSTAYARYEDFNQLERTKKQVENTLADLKQTQVQLVQSEKMASLGELTAGIAHEIQNPLNFVNNFAEVSKELLDEMKAELEAGNVKSATDLAMNVIENLEKINSHGKRADGIVKSMLQHSRKSSGQKELTDLNALCDEYLRLSYHGLRAKDKSFNAKFESDLDANLPKVSIVSQDIGRVVLNLINNAFYAVSEKRKLIQNGYEPTVTVSTRSVAGNVEISIKDNGVGIPDKVKDKIFQPFFTTKPAGQGTGLGLSLAYDIVAKGHGGELIATSEAGLGTEFIIRLPANNT